MHRRRVRVITDVLTLELRQRVLVVAAVAVDHLVGAARGGDHEVGAAVAVDVLDLDVLGRQILVANLGVGLLAEILGGEVVAVGKIHHVGAVVVADHHIGDVVAVHIDHLDVLGARGVVGRAERELLKVLVAVVDVHRVRAAVAADDDVDVTVAVDVARRHRARGVVLRPRQLDRVDMREVAGALARDSPGPPRPGRRCRGRPRCRSQCRGCRRR